jgi:predicted transcriptional regulator of viral defense system
MLSIGALSERLQGLNAGSGGVYGTADLAVLLDRPHPSRLTEAVRLLIREGVLRRLRRGLYLDRLHGYRPEVAGLRWVSPSYLSTESALDRHGLCQTGILPLTYVTTRLLARREMATRELEGRQLVYRHLAPHLFFGYEPEDGLLVARPEKAVLDFLYFTYKQQRSALAPEDIDSRRIDAARYRRFLRPYRQAGFRRYALDWLQGRGRDR